MTQAYSDPQRADDPHALPDIETFFMSYTQFMTADDDSWMAEMMDDREQDGDTYHAAAQDLEGWYWWVCYPGCLPDSEPIGPFKTEQAAIQDAQDL